MLKNIFISLQTLLERIGALYLMYAMYFKQPTKEYCKYRFTLTDWNEITKFYNQIHVEANFIQARMIFWRLWKANAFRFVESDMEYGLESTMTVNNRNEKLANFQKVTPHIIDTVATIKDGSTGLLTSMDIIQAGYNEMKEHLAKTNENCAGLKASVLANEIANEIEKFENIFVTAIPTRRHKSQRKCEQQPNQHDTFDDDESSNEYNDLDDSATGSDSNYEPNDDCADESDTNCYSIGVKRIYLKRKAMNRTAKSLIHGSSYSENEMNLDKDEAFPSPQKSAKQISPSPRKRRKLSSSPKKTVQKSPIKIMSSSADEGSSPVKARAIRKVDFDDERGIYRITPAVSTQNKARNSKNSAVKKQFDDTTYVFFWMNSLLELFFYYRNVLHISVCFLFPGKSMLN